MRSGNKWWECQQRSGEGLTEVTSVFSRRRKMSRRRENPEHTHTEAESGSAEAYNTGVPRQGGTAVSGSKQRERMNSSLRAHHPTNTFGHKPTLTPLAIPGRLFKPHCPSHATRGWRRQRELISASSRSCRRCTAKPSQCFLRLRSERPSASPVPHRLSKGWRYEAAALRHATSLPSGLSTSHAGKARKALCRIY